MEDGLTEKGPQLRLGASLVEVKKPRLRDYRRLVEIGAELRFGVDLEGLFSGDKAASQKAFEALAEAPEKVAEVCAICGASMDQVMDAPLDHALDFMVAALRHSNVIGSISSALKKVRGAGEAPSATA